MRNEPAPSVLDACGGGPTRGFVAASRGLHFTCIELREEQVKANVDMNRALLRDGAPMPRYVQGDGRRARELLPREEGTYDMLLMCPPYYNLERYSKLPEDLSKCESPEAFDAALSDLVAAACLVRASHAAHRSSRPRHAVASGFTDTCWHAVFKA